MQSYLDPGLYDLISPDGCVTRYEKTGKKTAKTTVLISEISPVFRGFFIDPGLVSFNLKSTLAQLGLDGIGTEYLLDRKQRTAEVTVLLQAYGTLAEMMLDRLGPGSFIGKLFAADDDRRVRDPTYLVRMFNRKDREGRPLLYLGDPENSDNLAFEKKEGFTVAFLKLLDGTITYGEEAEGFIPVLGKALLQKMPMRPFLQLIRQKNPNLPRRVREGEILLAATRPLHIRTVFARVRQDLLPEGYRHTSANILEPTTKASGDVYELFGSSNQEIETIPLDFFTLEPHREHVFFFDRDQLQNCLEDQEVLFRAFETAPSPRRHKAATFIVKGRQMLDLQEKDWVTEDPGFYDFPGMIEHPERQAFLVDQYIQRQPSYPFLRAMITGLIAGQGVLLSRHLPSPLMKKILLETGVHDCLKGIYFEQPSHASGDFFSNEDRAMLHDLAQFALPVYWVDRGSKSILQYIPKPRTDSGMFTPLALVDPFLRSTSFGIYGSNLLADAPLEPELLMLFQGLEELRHLVDHPLFNKNTPIAVITGGGPGAMEVGNKVAKKLGLLSCANIVDFQSKTGSILNEQQQNPYVDIKMTYRLDRLVERQAEFYLDFPIFLKGGIGTDFEYALEEVRRKVGSIAITPILLFGEPEYWRQKITAKFQCNLSSGTITGSEWIGNCFYCVRTAKQALSVYRSFFTGNLNIGKEGPVFPEGFAVIDSPV